MRILLFLTIGTLLILPVVYSEDAVTIQVAYCKHMGYAINISSENKPECVFEDETSCDATDFYKGDCGQNKTKEIPLLRKEGDTVYTEFERCEDGLIPSEPEYLLDQPECRKLSLFEKIMKFLGFV